MISKSEMKAALAGEFENGFVEAKKSAQDDLLRWEGSKMALTGAAKAVEQLQAHVARDVDEEKLTIEEATKVRLYVSRAAEVVRSLRLKAEVQQERAKGRMEAFSMATNMVSKSRQQAERKMASEDGAPGGAGEAAVGSNRPSPRNRLEELRSRRTEAPSESEGNGTQEPQAEDFAVPQNGTKLKKKTSKKTVAKKKAKKKTKKK